MRESPRTTGACASGVAVRGDSRVVRWCGGAVVLPGQASAAVMPTVDSMTGFIFLSSAS